MYKLPRGTLLGKRAALSSRVLKAFRKKWATARAQAIDEISVVSPDKFYQIDMRSRVATKRENEIMGGLATNISGDFLQLPPIVPSLAMPIDEKGFMVLEGVSDDKEDDGKLKERVDFEEAMIFGCSISKRLPSFH